ncbi:MAG: hypothetical protein LUC32_07765 [Clostridiales bacterium]|nr:hypothetical protein [Clostridiales bacterium]
MPDLGSDAAGAALNMGTQSMAALLRLLNKMIETAARTPERRRARAEAKIATTKLERQRALEKIDGKFGYVNHKLLQKSGEPLISLGTHLRKEDIKGFNEVCKREGVLFTAVSNSHLKKYGEESYMVLECKERDVEKVLSAANRFNDEKRISYCDQRMQEIIGKGKNQMTKEDFAELRDLVEEKQSLQREYCGELNRKTRNRVIDSVASGRELKSMDIKEALDRNTGRMLDKDMYTVIADAQDPSKVIRCHGTNDVYNGKPYVKTEYEVWHGSEMKLRTDDGRKEGWSSSDWLKTRDSIGAAAEFSGTFYKFGNEKEYKKWREHATEQNLSELHEMELPDSQKDYDAICSKLTKQLEDNGAEIKDGVVCDAKTGKPMQVLQNTSDLTPEKQALAAESVVIGKQLENYKSIQSLTKELAIAKTNVVIAEEGTQAHAEALTKQSEIEGKLSEASKSETELIAERKNINAVQAQDQTAREIDAMEADRWDDEGYMRYLEECGLQETEYGMDEEETMDGEYPDTRRDERVDETDPRQMSMEEAKGQIEEARAKDGARGADIKDRQVHKEKAKAATNRGRE